MWALAKFVLLRPVKPVAVNVSVAVWPTVRPFETGGGAAVEQHSSWRLQLVCGSRAQLPDPVTPVPVNVPLDASMPKSVRVPPPFELVYVTASDQLLPLVLVRTKSTQKLRVPPEQT